MALLFAACPKDDAPRAEVVIPYAFQYPIDRDNIEAFLNQNTMIVSPDFDVTFKRMEDGDVSIMVRKTNQRPKILSLYLTKEIILEEQ